MGQGADISCLREGSWIAGEMVNISCVFCVKVDDRILAIHSGEVSIALEPRTDTA